MIRSGYSRCFSSKEASNSFALNTLSDLVFLLKNMCIINAHIVLVWPICEEICFSF